MGVPGELYIGGAGVARGYLNRPELTAERFLHDPFNPVSGARMYRTGDLGRWLPDGTIAFLGRNDDQVKIRGFRIELGEIEARLAGIAGVREAVVLAREDAPGARRLVAYLTGDVPAAETLRAHLAAALPDYMVPAAYVALDALPLTPNGKLDRRALSAPQADAFSTAAYEAPLPGLEQIVAELWSELLGLPRIGRHDNFFTLGGHSLLAVQLISRLRARLGVELALAELFAHPTLAALAGRVAAAGTDTLPPLTPVPRNAPLPLSFAQQRLWFLDQLQPGSSAYAIHGGLRLRGPLHLAALQAALDALVARHEALRTTFTNEHGTAWQCIAPPQAGFALELLPPWDGTPLDATVDAQAEMDRLAQMEETQPFDLARGPLVRGRLRPLAAHDHLLLLAVHHAVFDGWSLAVFIRELSALYSAALAGTSAALPALPIQYADYAAWQRRCFDEQRLQPQLNFWLDHLRGAPAVLDLPTDRPRPTVQDAAGATFELRFDAPLSAALRALSHRHGTTLFMTLLAGWAALLSRLSGQHDLVIGTPVANRTRAEVEGLIGVFINTLALRVDLSGDPDVATLLARVRTLSIAAQAHQDLPFEQVVEALAPERSLAHSPVFQVMFTWQNTPEGTLQLGPLEAQPLDVPRSAAQFDLRVSLQEEGPCICGTIEYATALFDAATIERYVAHWKTLLQAMVAGDNHPVHRLPLLQAAERQQLLHGFNATAAPLPETLVHTLFEQQADRTPEATALVFEATTLSYAELNARANRLAHHLIGLGIGPDQRVALCMERGIGLVVALLATLKAGAAYVPLDPAYPAERLAFMLADCGPRALLTEAGQHHGLAQALAALPVIELDAASPAWALQPTTNPDSARLGLAPSHLAYVIYTSGSTGQPKGVMVEHRGLLNYLQWAVESYAPQAGSIVSSSLSFDATITSLYTPLLCGGAVTLLPPHQEIEALHTLLSQPQRCGLVKITPAHLDELGRQLLGQGRHCAAGIFVVGGEALSPATVQLWREFEPGVRLVNEYGPTETVVGCVTHEFAQSGPPCTRVPIGRPIANTRIYILDAHGEPLPVGVPGELYIGGAGVARGYLNRPELTAERFLHDPFDPVSGARMYRTGDLGRWLSDGTIEYMGRNDDQVKIRGFRIELGEIEARLAGIAGVREAVVLAREDAPGARRLVAYLTGDVPAAETLRARLAAALPDYMVPAAYVALDALPLTPNGKLDRRALPAPQADAFSTAAYEAPLPGLEQIVAELWSELLGLPRIGRHDNFFTLGGHSLLAVQLISRLRARLGVELALAELFAHPTLAALAGRVAAAGTDTLPPLTPVPRNAPLPLSFAQQRLWFLDQLQPGSSAYAIHGGLRLRGPLHLAALQAALDALVARHEALRTTFTNEHGTAWQCIAPPQAGFALELLPPWDGTPLDATVDAQAEMDRLAQMEETQPFDLARGPLVRGRLRPLAAHDHLLLLAVHHAVFDGWSLAVFIRELSALYSAALAGTSAALPALPIQYADYAAWQRRCFDEQRLQPQLNFWLDHLRGAPAVLDLPTDRPRPTVQDAAGATFELRFDAPLSAALRALSHRHGTTLFMTLLAGWAALLSRLSGQHDLVIGTPVANRTRAEVEGLIGVFINTLALRVDLSGDPDVATLLARVRTLSIAAQAHQDLPFEQVVEALAPERSLAHSPVFQVMFTWQNTPEGTLQLGPLEAQPLDVPRSAAQFDLRVSLQEEGPCICGTIEYATALFDAATIERYVAHWKTLLQAMVAGDNHPVHRLPLLQAAERQQLLHGFNATAAPLPETLVHTLFEQQADRTPEATALVFEATTLSYAELNARANRLAHHLIGLGIGPDQRVALCMERGIGLVVALLATLKAGAAYVPLDPAYPAERLAFMLADCGPRALLTEAGQHHGLAQALAALPVIELDAASPAWALQPTTNPDSARLGLAPSHLAYVIYTSGSTGQPKGVMVEHRGLLNYLQWAVESYAPQAGSIVSSSLSFDATITSLYTPLLCGGAVTLLPPHQEIEALHTLLSQPQRCGLVKITPAHLDELGRQLLGQGRHCAAGIFVVGGEALSPATVQLWREFEPGVRLVNEYGPTETVVGCVTHEFAQSGPPCTRVPIGRPIANTRIYILDAHGEPLPVGVPGELYIGGAGVARGYLNRPELTAERFLHDPFDPVSGARMYRTGDLGRWLSDGTIEYMGRNDDQVKIRGFRIELGEIEARLAGIAGVREAVVLAREDAPGARRLVAYLTGDVPAAETLRARLAAALPDYMVPAAYVALDALPLTPNGKLDRRALPAPQADAFSTAAYEAPLPGLEQIVAELWSELLGLPRIGRHDNFFTLGGHSLLAVQLISRLRARLGVELALAELFAHPTLAALAGRVAAAGTDTLPPLTPVPRNAPLPLSFAQQRLWFLDQLQPGSSAYAIHGGLRLRGPLHLAALQAALDALVARHEALRTTFTNEHGTAWQCIAPPQAGFALELLPPWDGTPLDATVDAQAEMDRLAQMEETQPFDLARGPLVRGRLRPLAAHDHLLLLAVHHAVFDGWSLAVFIRELSALYSAALAGTSAALPALPIQYADYAAWQRRCFDEQRLQPQLNFWLDHLRGAPAVLDLPTDRPRPTVQDAAGATFELRFDAPLSAALRALSHRHGTTLFMTLLAGWAALLSRLSGQHDLVIGTPVANRTRAEVEGLIGVFINTLALRVDLSGDPDVATLLARVRTLSIAAQAHQDLPFEQVVEALAPERSLAHSPVFQVMFTWQNTPEGTLQLGPLEAQPLDVPRSAAQFDLRVSLQEEGPCICGTIEYATALFDAATIERYVAHWKTLLQAMVAGDNHPVHRLPLLQAAERQQLLHGFNATAAPLPETLVHTLFEQQADRTPEATALVFEATTLSYAELNARANRLAHHLIGLGIGPDQRVALCMERGIGLVVALLATLKAGAAYVPLDPAYPAERLAFMLADCGPRALLTEAGQHHGLAQALAALPVIELDAASPAWALQPTTNPDSARLGLAPSHLAYVIYTSGSTGQPKG